MASFPNRRALLGLSIALLSAAGAARAAEAEAEAGRPLRIWRLRKWSSRRGSTTQQRS